jgi:hypothetical protein
LLLLLLLPPMVLALPFAYLLYLCLYLFVVLALRNCRWELWITV